MDFLKLVSPSYLFEVTPGQSFRFFWVCFVFFLLLIAIGQYLRTLIKKSPHKKELKRLLPSVTTRLGWTAFAGFVFLFFRYENFPYLAMRIFLIVIILVSLYQIGRIIYIYNKILPCEICKKCEKDDMKKYMPKPKKKKKKRR